MHCMPSAARAESKLAAHTLSLNDVCGPSTSTCFVSMSRCHSNSSRQYVNQSNDAPAIASANRCTAQGIKTFFEISNFDKARRDVLFYGQTVGGLE